MCILRPGHVLDLTISKISSFTSSTEAISEPAEGSRRESRRSQVLWVVQLCDISDLTDLTHYDPRLMMHAFCMPYHALSGGLSPALSPGLWSRFKWSNLENLRCLEVFKANGLSISVSLYNDPKE